MNVNALAIIQPWHPAMMYLIYCNISEEDMVQHRIENQPIPAGRLEIRPRDAEDWGSESDTVHAHKVQHCGIACHTVHLHKNPCASILLPRKSSRPARARATPRAWERFADPLGCVPSAGLGGAAQQQAAGSGCMQEALRAAPMAERPPLCDHH